MITTVESDSAIGAPTPGRAPMSWRPVLLIAAIVAAIHLAVATRYGWHRDEFYYLICGRRLAWGYVDQPPLTPLLARLASYLPGGVLGMRLLAIAAQVGVVVLTPILTAEFGGRRRAQLLTAAAAAAMPLVVSESGLFGTTIVDLVAWIAVLVLLARALRVRTTPAWLAAGLVAGIGLENKDTVAVLLLGIGIALVLLHRDVLRTRGPWLGGALAVLLALPNVIWDWANGWPNLTMAGALASEQGGPLGSLAQLPALLLLSGATVVLWVMGIRQTWSVRSQRWVLVVAIVAVVLFTASGGKTYYPAPMLLGLFAAGAVRAEARWKPPSGSRWSIALAVTGLAAILIGLPVLPARAENVLQVVNPTLAETYGWPQFDREVQSAEATMPTGTPVFTSNYGEAGALTILGPQYGFHAPVYSAHNQYALWGPPPGTPSTVLCVGEFDAPYLHRFFNQVSKIAPITESGLHDQEVDSQAAIFSCSQPKGSWAAMWPKLSHDD